jgi:hypothetical protein
MNIKLLSRFCFAVLIILSLGACKILLEPEDSLINLNYSDNDFVKKEDNNGNSFLEGSGEILHKVPLRSVTSKTLTVVKLAFPNNESSATLFLHTKPNFAQGYELKFLRVGESIRLITSLDGREPNSLGILESDVQNWRIPFYFTIEVDNNVAKPQLNIWRGTDRNREAFLSETREEGFPMGSRVGLQASFIRLYSLKTAELE